MELKGLAIQNLKCFGEHNDLLPIRPLTILSGKNNTGKSTILQALDLFFNRRELKRDSLEFRQLFRNETSDITLTLSASFSEAELRPHFQEGNRTGGLDHWHHIGKPLAGRALAIQLSLRDWLTNPGPVRVVPALSPEMYFRPGPLKYEPDIVATGLRPLIVDLSKEYSATYVPAVRRVSTVAANAGALAENGENLAAVAHHFLSTEGLDHHVVETEIRDWLVRLFPSLGQDLRIRTKMSTAGYAQIYLEKPPGASIPLAAYGSGIGSVMVMIANLVFLSRRTNKKALLLLEEPENSLHPELQRKLLSFLQEYFSTPEAMAVVTTHSPSMLVSGTAISLNRVWETLDGSRIEMVNSDKHRGILADLGFFNSHLLQSDIVLIVEGWSDCLIVKNILKTLGLPADENNISILPAGGANLKYFQASTIKAVNPSAIVILDSDRKSSSDSNNPIGWKADLVKSFTECGLGAIMSREHREIENLLPLAAVRRYFKDEKLVFGPFDDASAKWAKFDKFSDGPSIAALATKEELLSVGPIAQLAKEIQTRLPRP